MSYKILIPARLDSTRLPGKPLRDIAGKTLIQRVVEQAKKSSADLVCVATDSTLIIEHCNEIGVESILTKQTHKTGTDRLFEACELLKLDENEIVLNVLGDEPFIDPVDIQNLFNLLEKNNANMATLFTNLQDNEENDPSVVKLWMNPENLVKDFSRDMLFSNKTLKIFNVNFLENLWNEHQNMKIDNSFKIYNLLILSIWLNKKHKLN